MKTTLICLVLLVSALDIAAQANELFANKRFISVTGSAELNVKADQVDLDITLREYGDSPKVDIDKVEKRFMEIMQQHNIATERITFKNDHYQWYYWWHHRRDIAREKHYVITVNTADDLLALMRDLDFEGIGALSILNASNASIEEYRKQVKIMALQAAKEKATYLLESVGEKLGALLRVEEVPDHYWRSMQTSNVIMNAPVAEEGIDNISTIQLRFEVSAQFEIASN